MSPIIIITNSKKQTSDQIVLKHKSNGLHEPRLTCNQLVTTVSCVCAFFGRSFRLTIYSAKHLLMAAFLCVAFVMTAVCMVIMV